MSAPTGRIATTVGANQSLAPRTHAPNAAQRVYPGQSAAARTPTAPITGTGASG
jgi:hypothetical protein